MSSDTALALLAADTDPRDLYAHATDPEGRFAGSAFADAIRTELSEGAVSPPVSVASAVADIVRWAELARTGLLDLIAPLPEASRSVLARRAALASAPLSLVSGGWLQWLSSPGNADEPEVMSVLAVYAADLGVGHPRSSRGAAFLGVLGGLRLADFAAPAARLAQDRRIASSAFRLPAVLLAASRRPEEFRAQILGADLGLRAAGILPALAVVRAVHPHAGDWDAINPATPRAGGLGGLAGAQASVMSLIEAGGLSAEADICQGMGWLLAALTRWHAGLAADLAAARDPAYEMAELLRARAREGSAYHQHFDLGGKALSEWLDDSRSDPSGLLTALAASRLVKPGQADASSLVTGLVSERGPMFRVFSPDDLGVIRRWIDDLGRPRAAAAGTAAASSAGLPHGTEQGLSIPIATPGTAIAGPAPRLGLREAYHRLLNRTDTPQLRCYALDYVHGWLARACSGLDRGRTRLPVEWEASGLRSWLLEQHDAHGQYFERTVDEPVPSHAALVDSTLQLSPLTLIDGSWLRGFTDYEHASSPIGSFLFETYWDELGNGVAKLNHPLIYRQVLADMGIELPPTASAEFAAYPGFRDSSFELPVYWLAIGRFPQHFLPEILGLNLAMELSGVGGTYRRAHQALKAYGYSTRFVDIHNTIDNVATGHAAWAADAVDTHLTAIARTQGASAQATAWQRVRAGFRSLDPPADRKALKAQRKATRRSSSALPGRTGQQFTIAKGPFDD